MEVWRWTSLGEEDLSILGRSFFGKFLILNFFFVLVFILFFYWFFRWWSYGLWILEDHMNDFGYFFSSFFVSNMIFFILFSLDAWLYTLIDVWIFFIPWLALIYSFLGHIFFLELIDFKNMIWVSYFVTYWFSLFILWGFWFSFVLILLEVVFTNFEKKNREPHVFDVLPKSFLPRKKSIKLLLVFCFLLKIDY